VQLITIGVHQRTAPVVVRERLAFSAASLDQALQRLRTYVDEGMIISTCNRVEVYGLVSGAEPGDQVLRRFLAEWHHVAPEELAPHLYTFVGADAVRHLFRLAAGLDSMVLGEDQIMGQLKAAFAEAQAAGAPGQLLNRLVHSALATGKLVRTQTGIARNHLSTVSVALGIARETLGRLDQRNVLIVGAGRMAELALKHLRGDAPAGLGIANRTIERAQALAGAYGATAWSFDRLEEALRQADVVVSCTSAPEVVIDAAMVARALAGRERGMLLLDLAVPRDVDRQAAAVPGARLVDIDDMQAICESNRAARVAEVANAETLVEGEVAKFMEWWATQAVVPTIKALRERAEAIRVAEIERTLAKLPDLPPRTQEAIHALSAAIVNKLLHQPITTLKAPGSSGQLAQAVQQLFQLAE
jgi:glutamyl-tRNA reductase